MNELKNKKKKNEYSKSINELMNKWWKVKSGNKNKLKIFADQWNT